MSLKEHLMKFISNEQVKPVKLHKRRKFAKKWQVPDYIYNGERYPQMLSGSGYVMSRNAAECIYRKALDIPYFHLEVKFLIQINRTNV